MIIEESFCYYRENYSIRKKFDNRNGVIYWIPFFLFSFILTFTGLFLLFKLILNLKIKNLSKPHELSAFIFSYNQSIIHHQLQNHGLKMPFVLFSNKSILKRNEAKLNLNNNLIYLAVCSETPILIISLFRALNNVVLFNNQIRLLKAIGLKPIFTILLKKLKIVVQYNDHSPYNVLLNALAKRANVKSVYIQHAPVNENFPELYHDLNVLFSRHSIEKYRNGRNKEILPFFDLRFLEVEIVKEKPKNTILICSNLLDDLKQLRDISKKLSSSFKIILRPHPSDLRNFNFNLTQVEISKCKTIWEDLNRAEIVLTNESAVPLEAIFLGKLIYKCNMLSESIDNYGFIKNGLILEEYNNIFDLLAAIKERKITFDSSKLEYYIGSVNEVDTKIKVLQSMLINLK
jgi:hypothetical protein